MTEREKQIRINHAIRAREVRLIDVDGEQAGVVPIEEALALADRRGLDLVEVAPTASPVVCRVMDFGKYLYEQAKRQREAKKKQKTVEIKEMRFRPKIEEHDYQTKMRHLREFLEKGNRVRVWMFFRGREMAHQDRGRSILDRVASDLADVAKVERSPLLEGRRMVMTLLPK